jgi:hypothetical protein
MGALAAGNGGTVTGPGTEGPEPGGAPGPAPDPMNNVDVQGSGILATDARDVSGFTRVALHGVGHLVIEPGAAEGLTIIADDSILPLVTAEVFGDEERKPVKRRVAISS